MLDRATLNVSAWDGGLLIGLARSLSDFAYCTFLSDLAVRKEYQYQNIGKQLIAITSNEIGEDAILMLLSNKSAHQYCPKMGFEKVVNGFIIKRKAEAEE